MSDKPGTLFHFSFAVSDLDRARKFYGEWLGCPEGRKLKGRADFNFFGHHIVAHLAPEDVVGDKGRKIAGDKTPLRHFGVVMTLEDFKTRSSSKACARSPTSTPWKSERRQKPDFSLRLAGRITVKC